MAERAFAPSSPLRVVVTAGASGIGRAIAEAFDASGARVRICDIDGAALDGFLADRPRIGGTLADVADEAAVDRLFEEAAAALGGLDVLVNNAGIAGPTAAVEETSPADWRRCLDVNLTGQFLCLRRAVPLLKAAGGGAIIGISSVAGRLGYAYRLPYAATKWAIVGMTESLAKELGPCGIRVNAVLPGIVEGPRIERVIADRARATGAGVEATRQGYLDKISLRRMVTAREVADAVLFLASPAGAAISGQSLGVCGNVETL